MGKTCPAVFNPACLAFHKRLAAVDLSLLAVKFVCLELLNIMLDMFIK